MALSLKSVTKSFSKEKNGLTNLSFEAGKGILGLLGPNGAGKSTLMKLISTVSKPTSGTIILDDEDIIKDPDYIRQQLGYLPQDFGVYPNLNAYEFLEYIAALKGLGGASLKKRVEMLLDIVNLAPFAKQQIGTYSGGMKQRIGIAQALLNNPKVLILDEPTVGLDPEERIKFRSLITELANDCIVIFSSHIVSDIEAIATEIAVIKNGVLLFKGSQEDLMKKVEGKVCEQLMYASEFQAFNTSNIIVQNVRKGETIRLRYIKENNLGQSSDTQQEASLEDAYFYLINRHE